MRNGARLGLAVMALVLAVGPALAQSGRDLYQRALRSERNDPQLGQAVALYRRIVDEFGTDRQLAAQALLRLGGIYEITGSADATTAYRRLVRDFADQQPEVSAARQRLAAMSPPVTSAAADPPSRRLIIDGTTETGRVQRDGKHLLRYNAEQHTFELAEVGSDRVRTLVRGVKPDTAFFGLYSVLSRDGRKIAAVYPVMPPAADGGPRRVTAFEVRELVVGTDGNGRTLRSLPADGSLLPFDWSPDGSRIWLWRLRRDQSAVIASVGLDGTFETLKTLAWRNHAQAPSLSPDGRFVAYHDVDNRDAPADLFILSTDGTREHRVEHPADDGKPLFAPDGSGVVFESDRREGIRDLWFLPLTDGRPAGTARLVVRDVAPYGTARAFGENGSLFYFFQTSSWEIFVSDLDLAAGRIKTPVLMPPQGHELNVATAFSPDGRFLAYIRGGRRLVVRELASGAEREFPVGESIGGYPTVDWCASGDVVFVAGYRRTPVVLRMDLEHGGADPVELANAERVLCLGSGEDIVYMQASSVRDGPRRIVRRSLASGAERTLYDGDVAGYQLARSNDGAFVAFVQADGEQAHLLVVPSGGGQVRKIATGPLHRGFGRQWTDFGGIMWSPSGDAIVVTGRPDSVAGGEPVRGPVTLSRIRVRDGVEETVGRFQLPAYPEGFVGALNWSMSPTGSAFAFQRHTGLVRQVWAIDNLLAFIKSGKTAPAIPTTRRR